MLLDFFRVTPKRRKIRLNKPKGVLYSNPGIVRRTFFHIGTGLLITSIVYIGYLYWPIATAYSNYWLSLRNIQNNNPIVTIPTPTITETSMPVEGYSITIPKILAFSKVVDNVSPYDAKQYQQILKDNVVAQAKNTSYPGDGPGHSTYIFAHSTSQGISMVRKNAVFYLLGELKKNDEITIYRNGVTHNYRVSRQVIVNADQIQYLSYTEADKELLILQTCWPIGTDWKRLLILAEKVTN